MDAEREQLVGSDDMHGSKYIEAFFVDNDENVYVKYESHVVGTAQSNSASDDFGKIVVYSKEYDKGK